MPGMNGRELAGQHFSDSSRNEGALHVGLHGESTLATTARWTRASPCSRSPLPSPRSKQKCGRCSIPHSLRRSRCLLAWLNRLRSLAPVTNSLRLSALTRFDLHLPLKYRLLGESGWREGTTENISRSGMLFQAEEIITPNAQLEINLVLPAEIAGLAAAEVICRGEVVRTVESGAVSPTLAAKILQYHFQHGSRLSEA